MAWFPGSHEDTNRYKISISFRSTVGKTTGTIGNNLSEQYLPDFCSKIFKIVPIELPNIPYVILTEYLFLRLPYTFPFPFLPLKSVPCLYQVLIRILFNLLVGSIPFPA